MGKSPILVLDSYTCMYYCLVYSDDGMMLVPVPGNYNPSNIFMCMQ